MIWPSQRKQRKAQETKPERSKIEMRIPEPLKPDLNMASGSEWLSPKEAAKLLGVEVRTLDNWRCSGKHKLPYQKPFGRIIYRRTDICELLNSRLERSRRG